MLRTVAVGLSAFCLLAGAPAGRAAELLRSGDRVALVGGTFVEQMQRHGYFETMLQVRRPDLELRLRNLGWSGDDVHATARALFEAPEKGYDRLRRDLEAAAPTVAVVAYGTSEALDGVEAAERFQSGLGRLVSDLRDADVRVVLVQPYRVPGVRRPDYEQAFDTVREAIAVVGRDHSLPVVDLDGALDADDFGLLQPTAAGHYAIARRLAEGLGAGERGLPTAELASDEGDRWSGLLERLPDPAPPVKSAEADGPKANVRLAFEGLSAGAYTLEADGGERAVELGDEQRAVAVWSAAAAERTERLRQAVVEKNALFFHRYRPQNETYLYLFRKHEQGNNAAEIDQFEPLIEAADAEIRRTASEPLEVDVRLKRGG